MKRICVFCGSSPGSQLEYVEMAAQLGKQLAKNNIGLVYGGGSVGMMGVLANSVVKNKGLVTGVITKKLYKMEVAFTELTDLRIVDTIFHKTLLMRHAGLFCKWMKALKVFWKSLTIYKPLLVDKGEWAKSLQSANIN